MNDNKRVKQLLQQIEISKRMLVYLWNTSQPPHRFVKPITNATKYFQELNGLVVFEDADVKKVDELSQFFFAFRDKVGLNEKEKNER